MPIIVSFALTVVVSLSAVPASAVPNPPDLSASATPADAAVDQPSATPTPAPSTPEVRATPPPTSDRTVPGPGSRETARSALAPGGELSIDATTDASDPGEQDVVSYDLTIQNTGTVDAQGFTALADLSPGLSNAYLSNGVWNAGTVTWDGLDLAAGATMTLVVSGVVLPGTTNPLKIAFRIVLPDGFALGTVGHGCITDAAWSCATPADSANTPPTAQPDATTTTPTVPVTIAVLENDTDPDVPGREQTLLVSTVTQPAGGEGIVTTDHLRVTFTPSSSFTSGAVAFTYTVDDGLGGTAIGTVSVTMPDGAPAAADDFARTDYLTPVTADVLANDSDDDGEPLSISSVAGADHGTATIIGAGPDTEIGYSPDVGWSGIDTMRYTMTDGTSPADALLRVSTGNGLPTAPDFSAVVHVGQPTALKVLDYASDPNGDRLTVTTVRATVHAELSVDTDGVVTYTPDREAVGPDSFRYTVDDGHGGRATGTVTLDVINQAPVAFDDDSVDVVNSEWTTLDVLANDTDPDGDPLTILWAYATTYGTSEGPSGQVDVIAGRTRLEFLSAPHGRGQNAITYAISDGHGGSDTGQALVNVGNAPPETYDYYWETSRGDVASTYHVFEHTKDDNQDPLTLVDSGGAAHGRVEWTADGVVVYTPDLRFAGDDSFTFTVIDDHGGSVTGTVYIHVMAELHVDDDSDSTDPGVPVTVDVAANDTPGEYAVLDLTSLTLVDPAEASITTQRRTLPGVGAFDVIPSGKITFTPDASYSGVVTVPYRITEIITYPGEGSPFPGGTQMGTANLTITVTTGDDPPDPSPTPTDSPTHHETSDPAHRRGSHLADTGGPTLTATALGLCLILVGSTVVRGRRRRGRHA